MLKKNKIINSQSVEHSSERLSKEQELLEKYKQKTKNDKKIKLIRKIVQNQTKLHLKQMINKIPQERELYRYMRNLNKLKKNIAQPQFYATVIDTSERKADRMHIKSCCQNELKDFKIFSDTPLLYAAKNNEQSNQSLQKFRVLTECSPTAQNFTERNSEYEKKKKINELENIEFSSPCSAIKKKQQQQLRVLTLQKRINQQILPSVFFRKNEQRKQTEYDEEQKHFKDNFNDVLDMLETRKQDMKVLEGRLEPNKRRFHRKRKTLECEQFIREKFGFPTVSKEQFLMERLKQEGVREMQKNLNDKAQRQMKQDLRRKVGNQEEIDQQLRNEQVKFFSHAIENTTRSLDIKRIKFGTLNFLDQMKSYLDFPCRSQTANQEKRQKNIGGIMNDMKGIQSEIQNYAQNLETALDQEQYTQSLMSFLKEKQEISAPVSPYFR